MLAPTTKKQRKYTTCLKASGERNAKIVVVARAPAEGGDGPNRADFRAREDLHPRGCPRTFENYCGDE